MNPGNTRIIVGPPGTGKTTNLISLVESELAGGVKPSRIAFISFTKKAAEEGRIRAMEKFNLSPNDLPHFRTLHSMAFRYLGLRRTVVMDRSHLKELGDKLGLDFKGRSSIDGTTYGMNAADRMLFMEGLARNSRKPLKKVWEDAMEDEIDWMELDRFRRALKSYKQSRGVVDYTDMLELFEEDAGATSSLFDVVIVDEAQDLSELQWSIVEKISSSAERVYVAGDDDQSIYQWSGANVDRFIDLKGSEHVLDKSWRIPESVHSVAESIASRIQERRKKKWTWNEANGRGSVDWHQDAADVDLSEGTWLLLARNGYMLKALEDMCLREGFPYDMPGKSMRKSQSLRAVVNWSYLTQGKSIAAENALELRYFMSEKNLPKRAVAWLQKQDPEEFVSWNMLSEYGVKTRSIWHEALDRMSYEERDYFIAARRRGEKLMAQPRIKISTIHAAKGGEADHVLLMTDMSYRCWQNMQDREDDEARVFYVGATRCKKSLNLIMPKTNLSFEV